MLKNRSTNEREVTLSIESNTSIEQRRQKFKKNKQITPFLEKSDLDDSMMDSLYQSNIKWANQIGRTEKKQNSISSVYHLESVKEKAPSNTKTRVQLNNKFKHKVTQDIIFNSPPKLKAIKNKQNENRT